MSARIRLTAVGLAALALSVVSVPRASACGSQPYLGSLCLFGGDYAMPGYAFAEGQLLPIVQNQPLFSLLGTTYGGDGRTTFALPDTRGRVVIGPGQGPGLSDYRLGARGGSESVTFTVAQMPVHSHSATTTVTATATAYGQSGPPDAGGLGGNVWAAKPHARLYGSTAPDVAMHPDAVQVSGSAETTVVNAGGGQPVDIRQPYIAIHYLIALQGTFPSRN
jgi:microcystin-dependent protein